MHVIEARVQRPARQQLKDVGAGRLEVREVHHDLDFGVLIRRVEAA